jgi:hypothetical protein
LLLGASRRPRRASLQAAEASVVALARIRQAFGGLPGLSDQQVESLRAGFYELAGIACDGYELQRPTLAALESFSPDVRADIEERAAILEFDAEMSRTKATATALSLHRHRANEVKH